MKYLLDTCVISEFVVKLPSKSVLEWLENCSEDNLFLSVLSIGEIQKGISKLPESNKKLALQHWLTNDLSKRFDNRILPITIEIADTWGIIQGIAESKGTKLPVIDSLLAATVMVHNLTLVTRNTKDVAHIEVSIINPWL